MVRPGHVLVLASAAMAFTACSGADGKQATALLAQAQAAQARVRSASYDARLTMSQGEEKFTVVVSGGGYLRGRRAGDQVLSIRGEGLPVQMDLGLVVNAGRAFVRANGGAWQSVALPAGQAGGADSNWAGIAGEVTRYVKDVDVRENSVVAGEPGSMVAGDVDTAGLLKALAGLSAFSRATGTASPSMDEVAKRLGDTRVVLFISSRTHLIGTMVITLDMKLDDGKAKVQFLYTLRNVNRAVSIPNL